MSTTASTPTAVDPPKRRRGRPLKNFDDLASCRFEVWLTPRQFDELKHRGGTAAVKAWLDRPVDEVGELPGRT